MTILDAIILGLVEGITEYVPVSSTGHLILASALLGLDDPAMKRAVDAFNIVNQAGAILAVAGLYRSRVRQMVSGLLGRNAAGRRLAINLLVAFVPAAVVGLALDDYIEARLFHPAPVMLALVLGGLWMIGLDWRRPHAIPNGEAASADVAASSIETLTIKQALGIGLFQCVALWPGTSRSMMTIAGGTMLGLPPRQAAEFSFLLGLPTLGAACLYKLVREREALATLGGGPVAAGLIVATISAALAVRWLVAFLDRHGLKAFGFYRLALCTLFASGVYFEWVEF